MRTAHRLARPSATIRPSLVRRRRALRLAPPASLPGTLEIEASAEGARGGIGADLRFFLTCYAAGMIFFFVLLS